MRVLLSRNRAVWAVGQPSLSEWTLPRATGTFSLKRSWSATRSGRSQRCHPLQGDKRWRVRGRGVCAARLQPFAWWRSWSWGKQVRRRGRTLHGACRL